MVSGRPTLIGAACFKSEQTIVLKSNKMKLGELREKINSIPEVWDDQTVSVIVSKSGVMGGTPTVTVKSVAVGFDWNSSKFLIQCEKELIEKPQPK